MKKIVRKIVLWAFDGNVLQYSDPSKRFGNNTAIIHGRDIKLSFDREKTNALRGY